MALDSKGSTFICMGKDKDALECFDEILSLEPEFLQALNDKGVALFHLDIDESLECFNKALEIDPNFWNALLNKNIVFSEKENIRRLLSAVKYT